MKKIFFILILGIVLQSLSGCLYDPGTGYRPISRLERDRIDQGRRERLEEQNRGWRVFGILR